MKVLAVVEDEEDMRFLVRLQFAVDPDFELDGEAGDIAGALVLIALGQPDLIVLDHLLDGDMTGLDGAPLLKAAAPEAKIILFTANGELRRKAREEPAIDAFLEKTDIGQLVPLARSLVGLKQPV